METSKRPHIRSFVNQTLLRVSSAGALFLFWYFSLSLRAKLLSFVVSAVFGVEEFLFIGILDGIPKLPKKSSSIHVVRTVASTGRTTLAMFLVNLAYYKFGIEFWWTLPNPWRLLVFPLDVFLCEVLFGYYLDKVWNTRGKW